MDRSLIFSICISIHAGSEFLTLLFLLPSRNPENTKDFTAMRTSLRMAHARFAIKLDEEQVQTTK